MVAERIEGIRVKVIMRRSTKVVMRQAWVEGGSLGSAHRLVRQTVVAERVEGDRCTR
jgi:hypothetical protein